MGILIGLVITMGCVFGGYMAMGGYINVLVQPWEALGWLVAERLPRRFRRCSMAEQQIPIRPDRTQRCGEFPGEVDLA